MCGVGESLLDALPERGSLKVDIEGERSDSCTGYIVWNTLALE